MRSWHSRHVFKGYYSLISFGCAYTRPAITAIESANASLSPDISCPALAPQASPGSPRPASCHHRSVCILCLLCGWKHPTCPLPGLASLTRPSLAPCSCGTAIPCVERIRCVPHSPGDGWFPFSGCYTAQDICARVCVDSTSPREPGGGMARSRDGASLTSEEAAARPKATVGILVPPQPRQHPPLPDWTLVVLAAA